MHYKYAINLIFQTDLNVNILGKFCNLVMLLAERSVNQL